MTQRQLKAFSYLKSNLKNERHIGSLYKIILVEMIENTIDNIKIINNRFVCNRNFYELLLQYIKSDHNQTYMRQKEVKLDAQFYKLFNSLKRKDYIHKSSVYYPKSMMIISINPNPFNLLHSSFSDLDIFTKEKRKLKEKILEKQSLVDIYIYLRLYHEYSFSKNMLESLLVDDIITLGKDKSVFILYYKLFIKTKLNDRLYKIIVINQNISVTFNSLKSSWEGKEDRRIFTEIDMYEDELREYKSSYLSEIQLKTIQSLNKTYHTLQRNTIYNTLAAKKVQSVPLSIIELNSIRDGVISSIQMQKEREYIAQAFDREKKNEEDSEYDNQLFDYFDMYKILSFERIMKTKESYVASKELVNAIKDIKTELKYTQYNKSHQLIYKYIHHMLVKLLANQIAIKTFKNYIYTLNKHIFLMIENLNNIRDYEVAAIIERFENNAYSKNTIDTINSAFKVFFAYCNINGFVIDITSLLYRKSMIFEKEIDTILYDIEINHDIYNKKRQSKRVRFMILQKKVLILLAFYSGLRKTELRTRLIKDIYILNKQIYLDVNKRGMKPLGINLKTDNSKRRVELVIHNKLHFSIIEEWLNLRYIIHPSAKYLFLKTEKDKTFSKPISEEVFFYLNQVIKKITGRYATFHSLRHSYATYTLKRILEKKNNNKAYDILELSITMGHQTPEVTINKYLHFDLLRLL